MDVKFVTTTRELIDTVPITDGQVVVSKDFGDLFYDMYQRRYRVGSPIWAGIGKDMFYNNDASICIIKFISNMNDRADYIIRATVNTSTENYQMPILLDTEDFEFVGWFKDKMLTDGPISSLPELFPVGNITYYAGWRKIKNVDGEGKEE